MYACTYSVYYFVGILDTGLHSYIYSSIFNFISDFYCIFKWCRSTSEKDEAIAKRDQEIITLSDILKMKGEEIETKDDKIKELEEKFEIAMAELKEAKAELKEAKEDAKKNAEEVKEFPGALKTKEDQIQSLERQLSKSENDRYFNFGLRYSTIAFQKILERQM